MGATFLLETFHPRAAYASLSPPGEWGFHERNCFHHQGALMMLDAMEKTFVLELFPGHLQAEELISSLSSKGLGALLGDSPQSDGRFGAAIPGN